MAVLIPTTVITAAARGGVVKEFGMTRSEADHSVFYRHSNAGCIYLVVYVDDIVLTGSDHHGISQLK